MAKVITLMMGTFFGFLTYVLNMSFDLNIFPEIWRWPVIGGFGIITAAFLVAGAINIVSPLN